MMFDDTKEGESSSESQTCGVGDDDESCKPDRDPISARVEVLDRDESVPLSNSVIGESDGDHGSMATNLGESLETLENPSIMKLQQQQHTRDNSASAFFPFAVLIAFCCWGGWQYRRFRTHQKEWRDLSRKELIKIRQRSLLSADREELSQDVPPVTKQSEVVDSRLVMNSGGHPSTNTTTVCSQNKYIESNSTVQNDHFVDAGSCSTYQDVLSSEADSNQENPRTSLETAAYSDTLYDVRAQQQRIHDINVKSTKQQRRDQQKLRQKQLLNSLQHDAANEAYRRRTEAIMQEQKSLSKLPNGNLHQQEQTMLEELQEMERRTLLQQQNLEYLESLQIDQERAKIRALKLEKIKRQQQFIHHAKSRLVRSGVELSGLLDEFEHDIPSGSGNRQVGDNPEQMNIKHDDQKVQVRLLLPSGQRFQGTFAGSHCIGLLYDFALVLLEREKLLQVQEDMDEDKEKVDEVESLEDSDRFSSLDYDDYSHIKSGWKEVFLSFSLLNAYPRKAHNNLNGTLSESGLTQSATLLVVLESE
ncbi:hypothetical protein HJC23_003821 [Cyclotella cryptica]|uniref:UBX domain-containing protein n=1 Tax=Cyclotella cryptica TaxID=29204 RepID=A0ABD3Q1H0_9STRA|eukprot:CCRYP_009960-RA/>CCRYP_009960-RA protein AED:0.05 eAED:0.05 QI:0/-1/0/1/-1/1/1/0/531